MARGGDDSVTLAIDTESARPAPATGRRGDKKPNYPQRIATYNRQVVAELRKVIWPTRNELVTYTAVSVTFVVFMVAVVALFDYAFTKLVLNLFG
jgi:preprotein translocase subunit SecE